MNKKMRIIVVFLFVALIGIVYIGINAKRYNAVGRQKSITISGSTALLPLMDQSKVEFDKMHPDYIINVQGGGSGTGLNQVLDGTVNIGNSDMFAEEKLNESQSAELQNHNIVGERFVIASGKGVGVSSLTEEQIRDIFSGKITNWNQVGGKNIPILVIHRPGSSGTRNTFTNTIMNGDKSLENNAIGTVQDSNGAVMKTIQSNPGAISYLGYSYTNSDEAKNTLNIIKINGYSASVKDIEDGKYPFWSFGHMYTKGEATGLAKEFIDYVTSEQNAKYVEQLGYIPIQNLKDKE